MIVELRHGADCRSRRSDDAVLIDGNRRRNAFDRIDVRAVHAVEELARVGTERFDVSPLAFRIERVEDERTFPGAGESGDDREFADGKVDVDVLEIILRCAADANAFGSFRGVLWLRLSHSERA